MADEIWRAIPGMEGVYDISSHGNIRSFRTGTGIRKNPRLLKIPVVNLGYRRVCLRFRGRDYARFLQRLVLEAFFGPCPEGMEALHLDNDPTNNRIDNLKWGTHTENMRQKHVDGTMHEGEKHYLSVLNERIVRKVRRLIAIGCDRCSTINMIAKEVGCPYQTVASAADRRSWKHVL